MSKVVFTFKTCEIHLWPRLDQAAVINPLSGTWTGSMGVLEQLLREQINQARRS